MLVNQSEFLCNIYISVSCNLGTRNNLTFFLQNLQFVCDCLDTFITISTCSNRLSRKKFFGKSFTPFTVKWTTLRHVGQENGWFWRQRSYCSRQQVQKLWTHGSITGCLYRLRQIEHFRKSSLKSATAFCAIFADCSLVLTLKINRI